MSAKAVEHDPREMGRLVRPGIVGRDNELRLLIRAATTPPAVVVVEGEAGIGKTRLVRDALADPALAWRSQLTGQCHRLREPFPLGPVIEALRGVTAASAIDPLSPVVGAVRALLPELADRLPPALEPLADRRAQRHRSFRALLELLSALGPTVLVIEDLHWADAGTVELLQYLLCQLPPKLAVVLTYRREELDAPCPSLGVASRVGEPACAATISLPPLDRAGVSSMAEKTLATDRVCERLVSTLHEGTCGNPFALGELIQSFHQRGQLIVDADGCTTARPGAIAVPPALRDSILQRVGALHSDARLITEAAAVIELPACEQLLTEVAGLSPSRGKKGLSEALSRALAREVKPGLYALCHALAGQAVYEAVPAPQRRLLHLRAAQASRDPGDGQPLAQIAHHFWHAGRSRQWLRYVERAAAAAADTGDDRSAAELLAQALSTTDLPHAARTRMALRLGDAALFGRVPHPAITSLEKALEERSLATGVRGELRFCLARLLYLAGEGPAAHRQMVQAADELKRRPGLAARAMANLAAVLPAEGDVNEHLVWARRALRAGARQRDPAVMTDVLGSRAAILLELGDPAGWLAVEDIPWNAGSIEQKLELVRACKYLARATVLLGHYERAELFLERADRIRRELGHARFGVGLANVRAHLDWITGRWDGLETRARRLGQASAEGPVMSGPGHLILAWLLLSQGEIQRAEQTFDSVLGVFHEARDLSRFASAASGLARIYLARGDVQGAGDLAALAVFGSGEEATWTWTYAAAPVAVHARLAGGSASEARDLVSQFARGLRARDAPAANIALVFCHGLIAEADGCRDVAIHRFAQAERAWRGLPCPYEAAQALERRALCLLAAGERGGGDCLLGALESFECLGASWDASRVRAALRGHKVALPHPWRGGRVGYGQELSPREEQVAGLAGSGKTNREIAAALFLSPRTVENHVASAIRKRAVASRRELSLVSELAAAPVTVTVESVGTKNE